MPVPAFWKPAALVLLLSVTPAVAAEPAPASTLTMAESSRFAVLALQGIEREYPNKLDHVINDAGDVVAPRKLHPAFYGSFDWHSSVHGHWMLVRLLKTHPDLPVAADIRAALGRNLTVENLAAETAYLSQPSRGSFERTYGWTWLLKLAAELRTWDDADGKRWSAAMEPLAAAFVRRYLDFLPRQTYPIRTGVHPNTAFGLAFALDYADTAGQADLAALIRQRARDWFGQDRDYPAAWEPGGEDFLSPALMEADLMRRVLPPDEFRTWLSGFLPGLADGAPAALLTPAEVSDRTDPKIVHLDGLNLSRAACMRSIAAVLPPDDPRRPVLSAAAVRHAAASLPHVTSGDYAGEHWLASFAVWMLDTPAP